jgi:hypothetical protein
MLLVKTLDLLDLEILLVCCWSMEGVFSLGHGRPGLLATY